MVKRKTSINSPSSDSVVIKDVLYIPQLTIPYEITKYGDVNIVPNQVDEGMFRIRTPHPFSLDCGRTAVLKTNLKLKLPKFVDLSKCKGVRADQEITEFPRAILHCHIDSIYELLANSGIVVLGPRVLSADILGDQEISIYLQNIGKKMFTARTGDEIAELYFTVTPVSTLKLFIDQDMI